jgi:hypothetical protein
VNLAVLKSLPYDTGVALFLKMFVDLITLASVEGPERFAVQTIGFDDVQVTILNGNVAGNLFEKLVIALAAVSVLSLQLLDLGDVRRHLHDGCNLTGFIANRRRVDKDGNLSPIQCLDKLFTPVTPTVEESPLNRAVLAPFRPTLVNLVTVTPLILAEVLYESLIGVDDLEVSILNGKVAGHGFEVTFVSIVLHHSTTPC